MLSQHTSQKNGGERGSDDAVSLRYEKEAFPKVDSRSSNTSFDSVKDANEQLPAPWKPSILQIGPLVGLAALALAFGQVFVSLAVLKASQGSLVADWKIQPTVYLAVLTAISNKALAFATVQGTIVTFWLRAVQGTTIGQLQRDWAYGLHVYKAIFAGRHFSFLAAACILTTLVIIDGPLLQRASSVKSMIPDQPVNLKAHITPEVPAYLTGVSSYEDLPYVDMLDFSQEWIPVMEEYTHKVPIKDAITGCADTCRTKVHAPALHVDRCTETKWWHNFSIPLDNKTESLINQGCTMNQVEKRTVFAVSAYAYNDTTWDTPFEVIRLRTNISDESVVNSCAGYVVTKDCFLYSAIAEYDVMVDKQGSITFPEPPSHPPIVARANNTQITEQTIQDFGLQYIKQPWIIHTTLSGLAQAINIQYNVKEAFIMDPQLNSVPMLMPGMNWIAFQHILDYSDASAQRTCSYRWRDPRNDIMANVNELAFRTGVYTAQNFNRSHLLSRIDDGLELHQDIIGHPTSPVLVYHSDFSFFAGAASVELVTIIVILSMFYRFWRLGRRTSFSPLEIAQAFDSPMFRDAHSNCTGVQLARMNRSREVQYGVVDDNNDSTFGLERMVVADRARVHKSGTVAMTFREHLDAVRSLSLRSDKQDAA